ncbi:MAG: 16S rRNA (cytosine(967)-C(5))-methyltransferase RsmB, partial [Clostridia bacterium]|nr:16S rRNA (cytosine(967)-C(5))-methyltransferase RsmB [Clostridia bacterium]
MKSARELSFETLLKIEKDNSYSNLSIAGVLKDNNLEDADKAFFTALVYGVVERKITLDYNIGL